MEMNFRLYADRDPSIHYSGPLVILTSRKSASASEIVAGTLQAYKRAVIVGADYTFGKGSMQEIQHLPWGGAIKTTIGLFFTPGGFSTQHIGVMADIYLPSKYSIPEFGEKNLDYSLEPLQSMEKFLSPEAYVSKGDGAWKKVSASLIEKLGDKSRERVKGSPAFDEIRENLVKNRESKKLIRVGDLLEKTREKNLTKDISLSKKEKDARYLQRPNVQEAVNIMIDYIQHEGVEKDFIAPKSEREIE